MLNQLSMQLSQLVYKMQSLFTEQEMVIFALVLVLVTLFPIVLCLFRHRGSVATVTMVVFIIYVIGNLSFTILNRETMSQAVVLTPGDDFKMAFSLDFGLSQTIELLKQGQFRAALSSIHVSDSFMAREVLLNILLYLPLGYLLPFLVKSLRGHILLITIIGFCCSLATEMAQLYLQIGVFQVDDILLNTIGTLLGAIIGSLLAFIFRTK